MAVPFFVASHSFVGNATLPSATQPGDTIILVARSMARTSNQQNWQGSHGRAGIQGGGGFQVASTGWQTYVGGSIVGGYSYMVRVFAGVVPQSGDLSVYAHVGSSGPYGDSGMTATLFVLRQVGGVGATARDVWRLPASGPQSVGFFVSGDASAPPPSGADQLAPGVYLLPASGASIGPGGSLDKLLAVELLGTTNPAPPLQLQPADGSEVANGVPVEFSWAHQSSQPGGFQDAYRFRLTLPPDDDPTFRWWNGVGLVAAETDMVSTVQGVELPPSAIGVDAAPGWAVATREGLTGEWSDYSPVWSVATGEPPTVTLTGPTGPVHNTMRPVITWTAEARPGEVLVQYQTRLADESGAFVFDSGGQQGNPGQHAVPALPDWINGHEYTPWVRVRQTRGAWSAWTAGEPFPVTWDEPQTPTVTAWPGMPGIVVQASAPGLLAAEVERVHQDGTVWPVDAAAVDGVTRDVLAPYGQTVTYRARTSNTIADVTVYSEWASSGPVQSSDRYGYLTDANDPSRWIRFKQAHATGLDAAPQEMETRAGLGDTRLMVDKGPVLGRQGTLTARTDSIAEEEALYELLRAPLLIFRRPAEQRYAGTSQTWHDRGVIVLTVNQQPREEPLADNYPLTSRLITFGWVEQ